MRVLALVSLALFVVACPEDDERDRVPPRVIAVEPASPVVPVTATFRVVFSESLNAKTVSGDPLADNFGVALIPTELATDAFLSDVDNPPLSESRQDDVLPAGVELDDDDTVITIVPAGALLPGTAYTLVISSDVRDAKGNPIVDGAGKKSRFRWDFTTDAGPPQVLSTTLPVGNELVVPNRRRVDVLFNQPVQNVSEASLFIQGSPAPVIDAILLDETRTTATLLLGALDATCERLAASDTYTLVVTDAIVGDNEQSLIPYTQAFSTGASCDVAPNTIFGAAQGIAGETDATLRFETTKASSTEVRFGLAGGELDCLGLPCPVIGAPARTPSESVPPRFTHSVLVDGLTLGVTYDYVVFAEDDVGNVATGAGSFVTAPLPTVALNEVMANAPGSNEPRDEYIELANFGAVDIPLDGYSLELDGGDAAGGDSCPLGTPGPLLRAGSYLLLVGESFAVETYGTIDAALLVRSENASFCATLRNTSSPSVQSFVLKDAGGRPVSSFTAYGSLLPHDDGVSVERTAPDGADVAAGYCQSRADTGPTPGRENGVVSRGCE